MVAQSEWVSPAGNRAAREDSGEATIPARDGLGKRIADIFLSSVTRRIIALNLAALFVMVMGILFLNQFREGLTDARVQSLLTQGDIIAAAIASSATDEIDTITVDPEKLLELGAGDSLAPTDEQLGLIDFPINPEQVAPILRRLISPTRTRARIYDRDGLLILDSRHIYSQGQVLRFDLPPPEIRQVPWYRTLWRKIRARFRRADLPVYRELGPDNGTGYPEVSGALQGNQASVVRVNEAGEIVVSVAVPIQRFRTVLGALMLSTQGDDIDQIVKAERYAILRIFAVAAGVTFILSLLLAGTIAGPVRKLASAAERVRHGTRGREKLPTFSGRRDEIGHLARTLGDMTHALYTRIEAIESFAADVSHELKNPLTSLRSAVETLPRVKDPKSREKLTEVILHDIRRLDRLISDISDASRLDAELARADAATVDMEKLLDAIAQMFRDPDDPSKPAISLTIDRGRDKKRPLTVHGHDSRLGQVFGNLVDNALSFAPATSTVRVSARRSGNQIEITIDDDGPGIPEGNLERIFQRFYTDRADRSGFGQNSGLGLSISKQIVEAHDGTIRATNRTAKDGSTEGARFVVRLPASADSD
ncbi:MAG: stimulus-sensing domain-containing protein [Flavobacteriaceae bacterium]